MSPGLLTGALLTGLVTLAWAGPGLLRLAAPTLMQVPRLAIGVIVGGIVIWLGALLAIGPALAWVGSGPVLLSGNAAVVCQRCLAAANPFSGSALPGVVNTTIPALLFLALPVVLALALAAAITLQMVQRARRSRATAQLLLRGAQRRWLHGRNVWVVDAAETFALTFPARHGGIVLSTAVTAVLDEEELSAVLEHEQAHLRQRHHLVSALVSSIAVYLRRVPLVAAAADALPDYLEIAADNQARRHTGTAALVSALVKLGERVRPLSSRHQPTQFALVHACAEALHAAGPQRIRQLVRPSTGAAGAVPALAIGTYLVVLAIAITAVYLPYASAALAGCL